MRHIFQSLLTMEGRSWSGSWVCTSSTRAKAQQATIVHVQVHVEVHDEADGHFEGRTHKNSCCLCGSAVIIIR